MSLGIEKPSAPGMFRCPASRRWRNAAHCERQRANPRLPCPHPLRTDFSPGTSSRERSRGSQLDFWPQNRAAQPGAGTEYTVRITPEIRRYGRNGLSANTNFQPRGLKNVKKNSLKVKNFLKLASCRYAIAQIAYEELHRPSNEVGPDMVTILSFHVQTSQYSPGNTQKTYNTKRL